MPDGGNIVACRAHISCKICRGWLRFHQHIVRHNQRQKNPHVSM